MNGEPRAASPAARAVPPAHGAPSAVAGAEAGHPGVAGLPRRLAHRYLLVLRFALLNLVAAALLAAVWLEGWLDAAFAGALRWFSWGIVAVFVYGLALCAARVWRASRDLNDVRAGTARPHSRAGVYLESVRGAGRADAESAARLLRMRLLNDIAIVRHVAESLVLLGLVGTVVGFIYALSGVDPARAASIDSVAPMVATLIQGMSIALYTTLIGAVLHVWLMIAYRMLSSGTLRVYAALLEARFARVGE